MSDWGWPEPIEDIDGQLAIVGVGEGDHSKASGRTATEIAIHVKVDSGMHRLGATPDQAVRLATEVHADPHLRLEGFWTHFADADRDLEFTKDQLRSFLDARAALVRAGVTGFISHAANSAATLRLPEARLDLVRAGLILYGVRPASSWSDLPSLRPALTWQTIVTNVVSVRAGETVGYGRRFFSSYGLNSWEIEGGVRGCPICWLKDKSK